MESHRRRIVYELVYYMVHVVRDCLLLCQHVFCLADFWCGSAFNIQLILFLLSAGHLSFGCQSTVRIIELNNCAVCPSHMHNHAFSASDSEDFVCIKMLIWCASSLFWHSSTECFCVEKKEKKTNFIHEIIQKLRIGLFVNISHTYTNVLEFLNDKRIPLNNS